MPVESMALYLVRFKLPDGEHLAAARSIQIHNRADAEHVRAAILRTIQLNPDASDVTIQPMSGPDEIQKAFEDWKAQNPNRTAASEMDLDHANRLLNDPEIARGIAATLTPG